MIMIIFAALFFDRIILPLETKIFLIWINL